MMPNKGAKNIWIKKLSKQDRAMLTKLRANLDTSYNSQAVLRAAYQFFHHINQIQKLKSEVETHLKKSEEVNKSFEQLKISVREYFQFEATVVKNRSQHLNTLRKLSKYKNLKP